MTLNVWDHFMSSLEELNTTVVKVIQFCVLRYSSECVGQFHEFVRGGEHNSTRSHSIPMYCAMNLTVWHNFLNSLGELHRTLLNIIHFLCNEI